jgi:hypothetical protein
MNVSSKPFRSLAAQLGRLSVASVSVACTSVRLASTRRKRRQRIEPDFKPGHGEKIWIFSNFVNGQTVYSHEPVLKVRTVLLLSLPPPAASNHGTPKTTVMWTSSLSAAG